MEFHSCVSAARAVLLISIDPANEASCDDQAKLYIAAAADIRSQPRSSQPDPQCLQDEPAIDLS
ncbi:hypothetical protein GCM10022290_02500 [Sagittula marina]